MRVVIRTGILSGLLFASIGGFAQQPRYGERIEVNVVEVDAIVTDRAGNPVHGLTPEDFEILEGRKRQKITNFTEFRASATPSERSDEGAVAIDRPEPRTIILLIDSTPLHGIDRARLFDGLASLVRAIVRPEDRAGIIHWQPFMSRGTTLLEPTHDRDAVLTILGRLGGMLTANPDFGATADLQRAAVLELAEHAAALGEEINAAEMFRMIERIHVEETALRMRTKTAALQRLVGSISAQPGKKIVLYVAHDVPVPEGPDGFSSVVGMIGAVAATANAYDVSIYAIHPELIHPFALPTAERSGPPGDAPLRDPSEALRLLAQSTGGAVGTGPAAVERISSELRRDLDSYYSIGYRAGGGGEDRERKITVRMQNLDYRVRARRAYVEKSDETFAREQLVARLFSDRGEGDLRFTLESGEARRARRNRRLVAVRIHIPVEQLRFERDTDGRMIARVKVFVVAGNGVGEVNDVTENAFAIIAPPGITAPAGIYTYAFELLVDDRGSVVSVGLFDERTGLAGYGTLDLRSKLDAASGPS